MNTVIKFHAANTPSLDRIADNIRQLSFAMNEDILKSAILIGEQFFLARDDFPERRGNQRPGWHKWVEEKTCYARSYAIGFIRIYERARDEHELWHGDAPGATVPLTVLMRLASPTITTDYRRELFHRIKEEKLSKDDVSKLLKSHNAGEAPPQLKRTKRGRERFKGAIKMVCQLCETARELPVPALERDELWTMLKELEEARGHINRILTELRGDLK